jgi:peptidoglycan/LPS O-acetylase OafA/YrhL
MMRATAAATRERGYMPQLDALRFFAVLGVVIIHNWQPSSHTFLVGWFDWGTLGVRLFFVLSGFLITGILLGGRELASRDPRRRLFFMRQFYARRFLRIFPVYYAVLFALLIAGVGQIREIWPWLFSYGTNIFVWHYLAYPYAVPHFWTLAIEEQFYLVWPFVLLFLPRRWLMPFLLALCCLGPAWRLWASFHYAPHDWNAAFTATPGNVDFLAIGAVLALLAHADRDAVLGRRLTRIALPIGLGTYAVLFWLQHSYDSHAPIALEDTGAALVFCWLIGKGSVGFSGAFGRLLEWRPIVYLGKISYGIYIYHFLVPVAIAAAAKHFGRDYTDAGFLNFLATSAITFVIAALSWTFFERPINGLKRYFRYERVASDAAPEEPVLTPPAGPSPEPQRS